MAPGNNERTSTIVMADIHAGYPYTQYPWRTHRLETARRSIDTISGYIGDMHSRIKQIVIVGDMVEDMYPTGNYDPELAQSQMQPLGSRIIKHDLPLTVLPGNNDPFYYPKLQRKIAGYNGGELLTAAECEVRNILGDRRWELDLVLAGIKKSDGLVEYGHGHIPMDIEAHLDFLLGEDRNRLNLPDIQQLQLMLDYLAEDQESHLKMGYFYEKGFWPLSLLPQKARAVFDGSLGKRVTRKQSKLFFDINAKRNNPVSLRVEGHFHHAMFASNLDHSAHYMNVGTATSAFKLDTAEPRSTFGEIVEEDGRLIAKLWRCTENSAVKCIGSLELPKKKLA